MNRNEVDHEDGLAKFIADRWSKVGFKHEYNMPSGRGKGAKWRQWRKEREETDPDTWRCANLSDSAKQYVWDDINSPTSEECRDELKKALDSRADDQIKNACDKIFAWGGLRNHPSSSWLHKQSQLADMLGEAVKVLSGAGDPAEQVIAGRLRMDSGMTKVYAFADRTQRLVIYDGRVGAALGLLTARYCKQAKLESLPECLRFGWHPSRPPNGPNRKPSTGAFRFPRLAENPKLHVSNMWRATRILNKAAKLAKCSPLDLERALFMVGYDVSCKPL